jgi:hypothetical protein
MTTWVSLCCGYYSAVCTISFKETHVSKDTSHLSRHYSTPVGPLKLTSLSSTYLSLFISLLLIVLHLTCRNCFTPIGTLKLRQLRLGFLVYLFIWVVLLQYTRTYISRLVRELSHRLIRWNCHNFVWMSCVIILHLTCLHSSMNCFILDGTPILRQLHLDILYHYSSLCYFSTLYIFTYFCELLYTGRYCHVYVVSVTNSVF